ncbi:hypothetical protein ACLOJK_026636 [Asimina triloba]
MINTLLDIPGKIHEARGQYIEAMIAYTNALNLDLDNVPGKVSLGGLLCKAGSTSLPAARSILSDALRVEPTNRLAWYYLGIVHKADGRMIEASDCLQAASMLEDSEPVESYSSIRGLVRLGHPHAYPLESWAFHLHLLQMDELMHQSKFSSFSCKLLAAVSRDS